MQPEVEESTDHLLELKHPAITALSGAGAWSSILLL